jgi:hypothetical protein
VIDIVQVILEEYAEQCPLTVRQIYYVMIGRFGFAKDKGFATQLYRIVNDARRTGMIPMDAIRDDGAVEESSFSYDGEVHFFDVVEVMAKEFRLDRQRGQSRRLVLWCEAAGMVPQLKRVVDQFGIPVVSGGGYDSTTEKHRLGRDWSREGATTVLHVGDFDLHGLSIFRALSEDIGAFAEHYGGDVEFVRIAITPAQADALDLVGEELTKEELKCPNWRWRHRYQAEALDPRQLATVVREAVAERWDDEAHSIVLSEEAEIRGVIRDRLWS